MPETATAPKNESRLIRFWVFVAILHGAFTMLVGIDILRGAQTINYDAIPEWASTILDLTWTILYVWAIYRSLVLARESGNVRIRRPIIWMALMFVPILNLYVALAILPAVGAAWIKQVTRVFVSAQQVLIFLLVNSVVSFVLRLAPELIAPALLANGIMAISFVWVLRDVLLGKTPSAIGS